MIMITRNTTPDKRLLILIVEDVRALRETTTRFLQSVGYQVVAAENGWDAWQKINAGLRPDAIVTDIEMPVLNGMQLIQHIKHSLSPSISMIPILVCSSIADPALRDEMEASGVDSFQSKPIDLPRLVEQIECLT